MHGGKRQGSRMFGLRFVACVRSAAATGLPGACLDALSQTLCFVWARAWRGSSAVQQWGTGADYAALPLCSILQRDCGPDARRSPDAHVFRHLAPRHPVRRQQPSALLLACQQGVAACGALPWAAAVRPPAAGHAALPPTRGRLPGWTTSTLPSLCVPYFSIYLGAASWPPSSCATPPRSPSALRTWLPPTPSLRWGGGWLQRCLLC
jgi:hypothetical protein